MESTNICPECKGQKFQKVGNHLYRCLYCGATVERESADTAEEDAAVDDTCGVNIPPQYNQPQERELVHHRSRGAAIALTLFLGAFGVQKFYLGKTKFGIFCLLTSFTGFSYLIMIFDLITFCTISSEDFDNTYNRD